MATVIAKNQTAGALALDQLPVTNNEIPASGQVTLTDFATIAEIQEDAQLEGYINADQVLLNDGTVDLTKEQSLNYVTAPVSRNDLDGDVVKNNFTATADPVGSNDEAEGYSVGSTWVNTNNDKVFRLTDPTTASANWEDLTASGSGLTEEEHEALDTLAHDTVPEDLFEEYVYTALRVTGVITWSDITKTLKLRELQVSYTGARVTQAVSIAYDALGVEIYRLTDTYTYTGARLTSVTRVRTP